RMPAVAIGWAWYLVTLLPVIGLVQVGSQSHADRFTYFPSLGLGLAVVWPLDRLAQRTRHASLLMTMLVVVFATLGIVGTRRYAHVGGQREALPERPRRDHRQLPRPHEPRAVHLRPWARRRGGRALSR